MVEYVSHFNAILATTYDNSYRWNATQKKGFPAIVTYNFPESDALPPARSLAYGAGEVVSFSAAQRDAFRDALDVFAKRAGLIFVETETKGMITALGATGTDWGGWASYPVVSPGYTSSGTLVLDVTYGDLLVGDDFELVLHEIGHAVGLKHPHGGPVRLNFDDDITSNTVMSYNTAALPNTDLGPLDREALKHLYGGPVKQAGWSISYNDETRTLEVDAGAGDDRILGVRGKNDLSGRRGDDTIVGREGADLLVGGAGADVLRGMPGRDTLRGGPQNDTLKGMAGRDVLDGGAGNDRMSGGSDADRFVFAANNAGARDVIIDFQLGLDVIGISATGFEASDVRVLRGGGGQNTILRFDGDDGFSIVLKGVAKAEVLPHIETDLFL